MLYKCVMSSSETLERRFQLYRLLYHILCWNMFCTLIMLYTGPIDSCCKWTRWESGDPWMKSFLVPGVKLVHMKGIRTISTAKTKVPQTTVSKGNKMLRNATHTNIYRCALMNKRDDEQNDEKAVVKHITFFKWSLPTEILSDVYIYS